MIYSPRLLEILKVLVSHDDYVSTHVLAEALSVSNRTVFREIQNVNYLLEPFNIELESKSGFGYKLRGSPEDVNRLIQSLESSQNKLPYRNADERRELLMIECLMQTSMIKLSNLASIFDVSEGTISRDLDIIEEKLKRHHLKLIRRQGYGIEIEGREEDVRKAIIEVVHQQLALQNETLFERCHQDIVQYFQNQESGILGLLNQETVYNVIDVLEHSSTQIVSKITEHSYIGLVIHLTIAVERIRAGDAVLSNLNLTYDDDALVSVAKIIISDIESRFNVTFPEAEVGYVLMHLKGTRPRNSSQLSQEQLMSNYECMLMVESLVSRFSNIMDEDFRDDESLMTGLLAHLKPTLNRLDYGLEIRNPLLEEIKTQYGELFKIVKETTDILYLENNLKLSDDEIGYLTLHFGAAIERMKLNDTVNKSVNIGVVCASGIGISALLASRIKSTFMDADEVIALSVDDVINKSYHNIDLLVSTLEIESDIPIVNVNSLLRNDDILAIRTALDGLKKLHSPMGDSDNIDYSWQVIENIKLVTLDLNRNKEQVIDNLIQQSNSDQSIHPKIREGIMNRENRDSVIVEELNFVMYHAKIEGLQFPEVIFFKKSNKKTSVDYQNIDRGVFMIVPYPTSKDVRKTMSTITASVLDCELLVPAIDSGNQEVLIQTIKNFMEDKRYG